MANSDERRSESRLYEETTIFVEIYNGENNPLNNSSTNVIICNSLDLSANGIQIQIDHSIPAGTVLRICAEIHQENIAEDEISNKQKTLYLFGEVKWSSACDEMFNIGMELYDAEDSDIIFWKELIARRLI